jgi:hypothetical protein
MDPLSVSASILTLLSAAQSVLNGLESLRALGNAPAELLKLLNEVSKCAETSDRQ